MNKKPLIAWKYFLFPTVFFGFICYKLCLLQVGYARDHTLYALCEGYVKFTKELMYPTPFKFPRTPFGYVERRFVNVLERPKQRKLICVNEGESTFTIEQQLDL